MADQTAPAEPPVAPEAPVNNDRIYGIYTDEVLDFSKPAAEIITQIQKHAAEGKTEITVLVKVGRAQASTPKKAVEMLGEIRDLDGSYKTVADSAITEFANVSTKTKRSVSIG